MLKCVIYHLFRDSYKGALSLEEMAEVEEAAHEKAMGISLLINRDNEIRGILDGTILASRVSIFRSACGITATICDTHTVVSVSHAPTEASRAVSWGQGESVARGPSPHPPPPSIHPNPHPRRR